MQKKKSSDLFIYKKDFSARKNPGQNTYAYKGLNNKFQRLVKLLPGDHQKENLSLALAACELIFEILK